MGLAVALFAITVNFLQPLAHAALMRDAAPSTLWSAFCNGTQQETGKDSAPVTAENHECCLGLAHAATLAAPSPGFMAVEPVVSAGRPLQPADRLTSVGIRDGPHRPRGPPALA
ncbi:hypothetical protein BH10PSE6_BH10PSE6_38310 [soil metagenome]